MNLTPGSPAGSHPWRVHNPLPMTRRAVVLLPWSAQQPAPACLLGPGGQRLCAQVISEGSTTHLAAVVDLPGLGTVDLSPVDGTAHGARWEASPTALDQGRIRAEFDAAGALQRLCCDGQFIDWAGPALTPTLNNDALRLIAPPRVLANGPVLGQLALRYAITTEAQLILRVSAWALLPHLHVSALVEGPMPPHAELLVHHPTRFAQHPAWVAAHSEAVPHLHGDGEHEAAWLRLADADGSAGLAIAAASPLPWRVRGGDAGLRVRESASYVLADASTQWAGALTHSQSAPLLVSDGAPLARCTITAGPGVIGSVVERSATQVTLRMVEQAGRKHRVLIHAPPGSLAHNAVQLDAQGKVAGKLGSEDFGQAAALTLLPWTTVTVRLVIADT